MAEDTRTLTSFVGQLYDAKQREEEREHTVIVRKKGTPQVLLEALGTVIRVLFGAVSIALMAIAMLALLYDNTRELLLQNLQQLWQEICSMLGNRRLAWIFFENIDALLWRLAAILALVLVATLVVRLLRA